MDITGTWYNELGSVMVIKMVSNGQIAGNYMTPVSLGGCAQGTFALFGVTDTDTGGEGVGFSVCWQNCQSVTAWSGQAQNINGEDQIVAFWLLTQETTPDQDWASTLIGQDVFTRNPATEETVAKKSKALRRSHP